MDGSAWLSQGASFTLHVGVMALLALLVPPRVPDGETSIEDMEWIRHVLASTGAGEDDVAFGAGWGSRDGPPVEPPPDAVVKDAARAGGPHSSARAAAGGGGGGGDDASASRSVALEEASAFGMIGLLTDRGSSSRSAWGAPGASGAEESSGNMWGDVLGDAFGFGAPGLSGVGEGSCGRGEGIGIGEIGTIGHAGGVSFGQGFSDGHGSVGGSHRVRAPVLHCGSPPDAPEDGGCAAIVHGRLPAETVQRVVRQSFGRFRLCYEAGLRPNPGLSASR